MQIYTCYVVALLTLLSHRYNAVRGHRTKYLWSGRLPQEYMCTTAVRRHPEIIQQYLLPLNEWVLPQAPLLLPLIITSFALRQCIVRNTLCLIHDLVRHKSNIL